MYEQQRPRRITTDPPKAGHTVVLNKDTIEQSERILREFERAVQNSTVVPLTYVGVLHDIMQAFKVKPVEDANG